MNFQKKILVIDDDQRLGRTLKNVLSVEGYDVCIANSGALGIQKAFEYSPDLILCDIRMEPIDGYHVFDVLKESSIIDYTPFIFLTGNSEVDDIRYGMNLGADDYIIKPFNNEDLVRSIHSRLAKFNKLKEVGRREMNILFKISPNGIFIFNNLRILDANPALLKVLEFKREEIQNLKLEDIVDRTSHKSLIEKIQRCCSGILDSFSDPVTLVSKSGHTTSACLFVSVYERYPSSMAMIALAILYNGPCHNYEYNQMVLEVLTLLKKENITVTKSLGEKLIEMFKSHKVNPEGQNVPFFSKREMEVLCLSMEGLPMKMIADQLSISDRTVEKHRAKMMEKTGTNNIVEVIVYALRNNLIEV